LHTQPKKIKTNHPPPYSTLNPEKSSDSPSAKSKGVRSFEKPENAAFFEVLIFKSTHIKNAAYFKVYISNYLVAEKPRTIFS
jgi:hypothetical protein